ncbi:MAG TPA: hypothetical protein G4N98_08675 [Thermoflexia bacterium]|nr:hypothetical protein [Thermoflexia bacterium]
MPEQVTPVQQSTLSPEAQAQQERRIQIMIGGGGILLLALLIGAIVLMANYPAATVVIRDIAIVFVAGTTLLIGIAIIVLILEIWVLIKVLREEIRPLLDSVNDTASTVRGTTKFVSKNIVSPFIKLSGFTAAVRQMAGDIKGIVTTAQPNSKSTHTQGGKDGQGE